MIFSLFMLALPQLSFVNFSLLFVFLKPFLPPRSYIYSSPLMLKHSSLFVLGVKNPHSMITRAVVFKRVARELLLGQKK